MATDKARADAAEALFLEAVRRLGAVFTEALSQGETPSAVFVITELSDGAVIATGDVSIDALRGVVDAARRLAASPPAEIVH